MNDCNTFMNIFGWPALSLLVGVFAGMGLSFLYYQDKLMAAINGNIHTLMMKLPQEIKVHSENA